jgi:aldehyde oxidoreductase
MTGNAIRVACEKLLHALKKDDGTYRTYDEMVAEKLPLKYEGTWTATMCSACDPVTGQGEPFPVYMYGLFMTEVAVDVATGKTTVEGMTLIGDVGTINNKEVVDGQLYGGMAQGIGLALTEDFEDIDRQRTIASCGVPYIKDIPDALTLDYVETPREHGPFGAAGCGELPLTAPHSSVINAIHDATGAWVTHLPATPEKVKAAMEELR